MCDNCHLRFTHLPAFLPVPGIRIRVHGNYCSWNCAKRDLLCIGNRPWFSLLAITALKLGAQLPIIMSKIGRPPDKKTKQTISNHVLYEKFISQVTSKKHIMIPHYHTTSEDAGSPIVYDDDVSISHASLVI